MINVYVKKLDLKAFLVYLLYLDLNYKEMTLNAFCVFVDFLTCI